MYRRSADFAQLTKREGACLCHISYLEAVDLLEDI